MSYSRWSKYSDVYVIGTLDGRLECCGCTLPPIAGRDCYSDCYTFYTPSAAEMIKHLNDHVGAGHKVVHWAFERLRVDARREEMIAAGYVRQKSRWQLPRQLGLTRVASTAYSYRGSFSLDRYPTNYHCFGKPEHWVLAWAEKIAELPIPIDARRRALRLAAADPRRQAAIEAVLIAKPDYPRRIIQSICEI